ncbi:hypothetical protein Sjap_022600 [Stephania japonica]|uniref:Hflx-type G domain-containing protein n=1 Tax=Stephania japonica TaxID=461633 RepID=A0AAP0EWE9_9MAGN
MDGCESTVGSWTRPGEDHTEMRLGICGCGRLAAHDRRFELLLGHDESSSICHNDPTNIERPDAIARSTRDKDDASRIGHREPNKMDPQSEERRGIFLNSGPHTFMAVEIPRATGERIVSHRRRAQRGEHERRGIGQDYRNMLGPTPVWWTNYQETHADPATWAEFREIFYDRFIPMEVRRGFYGHCRIERLRDLLLCSGVEEVIASAIVSSRGFDVTAMFERALTYETFLLLEEWHSSDLVFGIERERGFTADGGSKRQCEESIEIVGVITGTMRPDMRIDNGIDGSRGDDRDGEGICDTSLRGNRLGGSDGPPRDSTRPMKEFTYLVRVDHTTLIQGELGGGLGLMNDLEVFAEAFNSYLPNTYSNELISHNLLVSPLGRSMSVRVVKYVGPRCLSNVKQSSKAAGGFLDLDVDVVFVNAIISGVQQRNLERAWGKAVLDRVGLIIEIFNAHAETKEAMLQSELAALMYKRTRLVRVRGPDGKLTFGVAGEAEVVSARGRGSGGRGFISGAGETELQLQRRRIQERRNHLLSQIEEVRRTRALQRASRKRRGDSLGQGLSTVAVVGYTNAGKSTLVSALSDSELYSDNRLFATVDTRVRSVVLPSGRKVLLSDTVGFISDLPVQLVEAFHATLEEVVEADLLVHVLDSSAENLEEQRSSVLQVLQQIGVPEDKLQNMIEVWNKIDLRGEATGVDESLSEVADSDAGCYEEAEELEGDCDASSAGAADGDDAVSGSEENHDTMDDQQNVFLEEWSTANFPQDGSSECWKTANDKGRKSLAYPEMIGGNPQFQPPDSQCVETSAIMGVGLQELLYLIDEKLNVQGDPKTMGFDGFNRKWRPPRSADVSAAAVE